MKKTDGSSSTLYWDGAGGEVLEETMLIKGQQSEYILLPLDCARDRQRAAGDESGGRDDYALYFLRDEAVRRVHERRAQQRVHLLQLLKAGLSPSQKQIFLGSPILGLPPLQNQKLTCCN